MRSTIIIALTLAFALMSATAQDKQFTLEDLNFGGSNYRQMTPENRNLVWWGDELVHTDGDAAFLVDPRTGHETALDSPRLEDFNAFRKAQQEERTASGARAFVKDDNLFVEHADGDIAQLTTDGSRNIVYGQSVHRDEWGIYKGTFWSPDGQRLAFYRMDQSMVADYPLVNIDSRIAEHRPEKYPMAGETSHKVTVGVYDLRTRQTVYLQAGDPTDRYFTNIAWHPNGNILYMIELNRDQTDMALRSYDALTGQPLATIYTEHHDKYVHPMNPIVFLPWDDTKCLLQSECDGYNHLYLIDLTTLAVKQLTQGPWVVLDLVGFNKEKQTAIILTTEASPIQNNIYSLNLKTLKRTPLDNGRGCHTPRLSESGQWLVDNYTEPTVPRVIDIVATASKPLTVNYFTAPDPWAEKDAPDFSCGTIKAADGTTDLYYRMVKPVGFNPEKKYPTIVYVYGGPGVRNVEARWHYWSRGWETYMAQKGYLLFILDNRGSKYRGLDFEQATFRQLGVEEMKDQMCGVDYLRSMPYVDANRLGVHGWSYGGYMTISLMTTYPDVFKVGVAGGPVIDWRWYEVMYGERYMDTPQTNPEGYEQTSLIPKAKNLKGKLQIIIGTEDPTVLPQHALSFLKACIAADTYPDYFVYPGEGHNMRGRQSVHLHERITQYFEDYLK